MRFCPKNPSAMILLMSACVVLSLEENKTDLSANPQQSNLPQSPSYILEPHSTSTRKTLFPGLKNRRKYHPEKSHNLGVKAATTTQQLNVMDRSRWTEYNTKLNNSLCNQRNRTTRGPLRNKRGCLIKFIKCKFLNTPTVTKCKNVNYVRYLGVRVIHTHFSHTIYLSYTCSPDLTFDKNYLNIITFSYRAV